MASDKEIALYYPHINITDTALIKTAALYWDELQTIVPESYKNNLRLFHSDTPYELPYSGRPSVEAFQEKFLKPRYVNSEATVTDIAGREFANDIRYESVKRNIVSLNRGQRKYSLIHFDKWAPKHLRKIWRELESDFAFGVTDAEDQLVVPEPIADAYMSRLASAISQTDGSVPLTNVSFCHIILLDRLIDFESQRHESQAELVKLSLETVSIDPDVPLVDILRFRGNHRDQLNNLRRSMRKLFRQIDENLSLQDKHNLITAIVEDEVLQGKQEVERKLTENGIRFLISIFTVALPSMLGVLAAGDKWPLVFAGGAISLSAPLVFSIRKDRNLLKDHPFGYLYQAQEHFGKP